MTVNVGNPRPRLVPPRPWLLLLVDDEPDILTSLKVIIESSMKGTKVLTCGSGREALDIMAQTPVDAIIADFKMPRMDGIELLYLARKHYPTVPRIMLTAYADDELVRRAFVDAFVDEFVPKMLDPGDFLDRVAAFLNVRRLEPAPVPLLPQPAPPAAEAP